MTGYSFAAIDVDGRDFARWASPLPVKVEGSGTPADPVVVRWVLETPPASVSVELAYIQVYLFEEPIGVLYPEGWNSFKCLRPGDSITFTVPIRFWPIRQGGGVRARST